MYRAVYRKTCAACDCAGRSEMAEVIAYEQRGNRSFQLVYLLSGMLAFFINMSQIWCTKVRL